MANAILEQLTTPSLLVEEARFTANIQRLYSHLTPLGVLVRPHLKTVKSVEAARRILAGGEGPATVSTLKEAEIFAAAGISDIIYAVGIAPQKLGRVLAIRRSGCDLKVVLDSVEQAQAVAEASRQAGDPIPVLIEIDCDGHRSGVAPDSSKLLDIGRALESGGAALVGVLTHAGESYEVEGPTALVEFAERERLAAVSAANTLRQGGLPCPIVSVGSTPTAHFAQNLDGVTEVRAGVFAFFDLVMAGIGVCSIDDIALSVLTRVIGHQHERGWIITDAGWMALSRDRGTAGQLIDQGYGLVCDERGCVIPDLIVTGVNQEHGVIAVRPGSDGALPDLPVGTLLRILPNHACATAAQFDRYAVIPLEGSDLKTWQRFGGW
ncbi:alanine racemase [Pseudomonas sp. PA15(2017)]|uniref:DSD1 family PLP-dependent enzyme n=1 Tax=Pseudomonas sp. PA15(2017) TaxID=1932111 RepID=UPI00095DC1DA|nr:DSD1 family PLP-dependent enzyme [Pseudomonas sp. PA15(2017)]OLU34881.1 alanine racemase [Pseudomonas sp. PA15(2017)]